MKTILIDFLGYYANLFEMTFTDEFKGKIVTDFIEKCEVKIPIKDIEFLVTTTIIEDVVAKNYSCEVKDITTKSRKRATCEPRQIAMYFEKEMTRLSLEAIGQRFGNKDHATVLHSVKTIKNLIDTDLKFKQSIESMTRQICLKSAWQVKPQIV